MKTLGASLALMALSAQVLVAEPASRLEAKVLLAHAKACGGEVYMVSPPAALAAQAPPQLAAYRSLSTNDYLAVWLPVPANGYYALRSKALWGPWAPGRLGRFQASAGGVQLPGVIQGWYGTQPDPAYRMTDITWGVAHFSAPEVEVRFALTHGGQGNLLVLADLRLEPVAETDLRPEEHDRKIPAGTPVPRAPAAGGERLPILDVKQQRGLEWSTLVPPAGKPIQVDGRLDEWQMDQAPIRIDASIVPQRGWAAPGPESDADCSGRVALAWDDQFLYLAALIRDDEKKIKGEQDPWDTPFAMDSLVVTVATPKWLVEGARSTGPTPLQVMFGLSYAPPGMAPRPLGRESRYVVGETRDGYTLEAALSVAALGWSPAALGDRFPFALILVDVDPSKPGGKQFDQYGWDFGPGSAAGMGEARLLGLGPAAGEVIPELDEVPPGQPLRYVGTVDAGAPARLLAIDLVRLDTGATVKSFETPRALPGPGRYRLWGELPLPDLQPGRYDLRLRWE